MADFNDEVLETDAKIASCYEYFYNNQIENREDLREKLKTNPIQGIRTTFIEAILPEFLQAKRKKQQKTEHILNTNSDNAQKIFVINDAHIPFQDNKVLDSILDCMTDEQPQYLVMNGDMMDFYALSKFSKRPDRVRNLQEEIYQFRKLMQKFKKNIPNTKIHYICGNHEDRLEKRLMENPGLFGLKALDYDKLLHLDNLGIAWHRDTLEINGFIYYHGDKVSKDSSYSAKQESINHGGDSGISGHTHRLGSYYTTYKRTPKFWYENGCVCKIEPEYIRDENTTNWQHAFSVVTSYADGFNHVNQVLIDKYRFVYNGKLYV